MEKMLIDGQAAEAGDGRTIDVENPANRTLIAQVPPAGEADVDRAVAAAARAFDAWRAYLSASASSWNSAHPSRGCSQQDLVGTGGAGLIYCFAID